MDGSRLIGDDIAEGAPELLRQVRTVIGDAGQPVSLDSACHCVRHAKLKNTTERNMRTGGAPKTPARHAEPGSASASAAHIRDPLIGFVGTPSGVTFVIGRAGPSPGYGESKILPRSFDSPEEGNQHEATSTIPLSA